MKYAIVLMLCVVVSAMTFGYTMYRITYHCRTDHVFTHAFYTYECR